MNIVLTVLISGLCGMLLVAIPFLLKYLCEISYSLRRLNQDFDYYSCEFLSRFDVSNLFDFDDKNEE